MTAKVPVRATFTGSDVTGLAEYQSGEFVPLTHGGLGASLTIGSAGQVLKVNGAGNAIEFGAVEAIINIDGATDLTSATLQASDQIMLSDGGTEGRVTLSQLDTLFKDTTQTLTNKTINSDSNTITLDLSEGTLTGTTAQFNSALSDGSFATLAGSETLTNKTITNPTITGGTFSGTFTGTMDATGMVLSGASPLVFEGATDDAAETTLAFVDPTVDRTITFPNATGTIVLEATGSTLTNKSIDLGNNTISGSLAEFNTALQDDSFVGLAATQTLTNKTLTSAVLNTGVSGSAILDEDDLSSNSATHLATQQSIKAYVDAISTTLTIGADSGSNDGVVVGTDTLTFAGGTGVDTTVSDNQISIAIDSTVTTLTGIQTLTNKTLTSPTITGTGAIAGTFTGNITGDVTGNADTATALATARTIGGVSFDGTANINLPGVNTSGNQDTSGNAATATTLETARTIAGQSFDGSANITIASTDLSNTSNITLNDATQTLTNKTLTSPVIANITSTADIDLTATNDVNIPANVGLTFGDDGEKIEGDGTNLTISSSNNVTIDAEGSIFLSAEGNGLVDFKDGATTYLRVSEVSNNTILKSMISDGDFLIKGNDGGTDITALTFDMSDAGSATFNNNVSVGGNAVITGNLTVNGSTTTLSTTNSTIEDRLIELGTGTTGTPGNDMGLVFERGDSDNAFVGWDESADKFIVGTGTFTGASTGNLTITTGTLVANLEGNVTGDLTGDVTGNVTGNVTGDVTGNADTATALATARTIAGQSFDGSANITIASTDLSNTSDIVLLTSTQTLTNKTLTSPTITGTGAIAGTFTGDITGDVTGNADTATTLATARTIGGVSFDGSANIDLPGVNTSGNQDTSGNAATATTLATARTIAGQSFDGSANITIASTDLSNTSNIALLDATQTLTNKTLTSPTINTATISLGADLTMGSNNIVFEGATADAFETTLTVIDPTADRTITFQNASGTVAFLTDVTGGSTPGNFTTITLDNNITFEGATADDYETTLTVEDPTADRTVTIPNATGTIVLQDTTDTLTNKTLTSPVIANITSTADIDLTATNDVNIPANVGLTFGDDGEKIEGNGTLLTISSSNNIVFDANNDILLDSGGGAWYFNDDGSTIGSFINSSSDFVLKSQVQDKDLIFKGNDGGSEVTALTLDMSDAGSATFNNNISVGGNATITGNLTVNGTTTTLATTNSVISDRLIELGNGTTGTPGNDMGIVLERGDSDNAFIGWDESVDKFIVGTGTFTGASTGNLTITTGTLVANVEGNVTGDLTGDVTGNVTGNVTGDVTGNADTATALETARTIAGQSFDGTGNITIASTDLSNTSNITLNDATQTLTNKTLTSPVISTISNTGTITLPSSTDTLVGRNTTDTLTNKTIDTANNTITVVEADISDLQSYILVDSTDTLQNKTINLSDNTLTGTTAQFNSALSDGSFATLAGTETLTGKTINTASNTITVVEADISDLQSYILADSADTLENKTIALGSNTISGSLAEFNSALSDGSFASLTGTETLTNKTLTSPVIDTITNVGTLTLPTSTDTLVGRATTDTLTNKSISLTNNTVTGTLAEFNTAVSDATLVSTTGTETLTNKTLTSPEIDTITTTTGNFVIDATNTIILDSDSGIIQMKDGGSQFGAISKYGDSVRIAANLSDGDIVFRGNDGGVGISALTLDMSEAGNAIFNNNVTVGNDLVVTGNLTVSGSTTTVNTETINLADNTIVLNSNATGSATENGGIEIERGDDTNKTLLWNETSDKWTVGSETFVAGTFEGDLTGNVTGNVTGDVTGNVTGDVTGNADTATALETARTIGGVSFDGTANIDLPGVNTTGNQDTSGNAATATALETARTIAGQSFDGTANITIASTDLSDTSNVTLNDATQTLTNKTLTSPTISGPTITGDATFDTNTLHVDSTNNRVGIGTTSPAVGLDFQMINSEEGFRIRRHNASSQYIDISETDGSRHEILGFGSKEFRMVNTTTESDQGWHFYRNGSERFRILGDGLITLPSGAATLVGDTTTQTLTNKTIDASSNTISNIGDSQLTTGIDAAKISSGSVSNTEFDYLNGVTSDIQTQIDNKATKGFAIAMAIAL